MTTGLWMVGARGSLATTVAVGLQALQLHAADGTGMVTALADFADVDLVDFADVVIGGHDVSEVPIRKRAEVLAADGVFPSALLVLVGEALDDVDGRVRHGIVPGTAARTAIAQVQDDLAAFVEAHGLDRVVVVNVASTEPLPSPGLTELDLADLDALLDADPDGTAVPASVLYAYAAIDAGHAHVNFTPSLGASFPAMESLAVARGVPHAGRDGKTGETLVKTALAPMFRDRNLRVRSWSGLNLLGGGDGRSLAEPERAASKLASKARSLESILGYRPQQPVHIEHVADMGQWKTAWNHIGFEGFLGTAMRMQVTWEGCDSALAAPLVIDLLRLADAAQRAGRAGAQGALGFFFKDPTGSDEHRLEEQYRLAVQWARALSPTA